MQDSKKEYLPIQHGIRLSKDQSPQTKQELERMSRVLYDYTIVSIMYVITCTRTDVLYSLSMVSRYKQNPGDSHWMAIKNILKYLKRTKDMFLVYGGKEELKVTGYIDASFQTYRDNLWS